MNVKQAMKELNYKSIGTIARVLVKAGKDRQLKLKHSSPLSAQQVQILKNFKYTRP